MDSLKLRIAFHGNGSDVDGEGGVSPKSNYTTGDKTERGVLESPRGRDSDHIQSDKNNPRAMFPHKKSW